MQNKHIASYIFQFISKENYENCIENKHIRPIYLYTLWGTSTYENYLK